MDIGCWTLQQLFDLVKICELCVYVRELRDMYHTLMYYSTHFVVQEVAARPILVWLFGTSYNLLICVGKVHLLAGDGCCRCLVLHVYCKWCTAVYHSVNFSVETCLVYDSMIFQPHGSYQVY